MNYSYVAYTKDRKLVKGKLSAPDDGRATDLLSYGGYQVVSLKSSVPFFDKEKLLDRFSVIKPREVVVFSRQLALLLESGSDIVTCLELIQSQIVNPALRRIVADVVSDIRGGSSLSTALSKHPQAFSQMYYRAMAAGEQGGSLEVVLRQMAEYTEKRIATEKKLKSALTYPIIVAVIAILVVGLLVTFVLPTFIDMIAGLGGELPLATRILMAITDWFGSYGPFLMVGLLLAVVAIMVYIKTPGGKYRWDTLILKAPVLGRIFLLSELSRCCQSMAMLFKVGLPLPEIMSMAVHSTTNKAMAEALIEVQQELIAGEGLARPMSKRKIFLPLMVQMVKVGEGTGNLDQTLVTVAQSYEVEGDDRITAAVGLIQPAMIIIIGLVVGFIAVALISAMFGMHAKMA